MYTTQVDDQRRSSKVVSGWVIRKRNKETIQKLPYA